MNDERHERLFDQVLKDNNDAAWMLILEFEGEIKKIAWAYLWKGREKDDTWKWARALQGLETKEDAVIRFGWDMAKRNARALKKWDREEKRLSQHIKECAGQFFKSRARDIKRKIGNDAAPINLATPQSGLLSDTDSEQSRDPEEVLSSRADEHASITPPSISPEDKLMQSEKYAAYKAWIKRLPSDKAQIVKLKVKEGLTYQQIAEIRREQGKTDTITEKAVGATFRRLRDDLESALTGQGFEPLD